MTGNLWLLSASSKISNSEEFFVFESRRKKWEAGIAKELGFDFLGVSVTLW